MEIKNSIEITKEGLIQQGDNISIFARKRWVAFRDIEESIERFKANIRECLNNPEVFCELIDKHINLEQRGESADSSQS